MLLSLLVLVCLTNESKTLTFISSAFCFWVILPMPIALVAFTSVTPKFTAPVHTPLWDCFKYSMWKWKVWLLSQSSCSTSLNGINLIGWARNPKPSLTPYLLPLIPTSKPSPSLINLTWNIAFKFICLPPSLLWPPWSNLLWTFASTFC